MDQDLITVLYRSVALLKEHSCAEADMLAQARLRNQQLGITGFLHREDDVYFQVFEGPAAAVNALLERILRDSRHTNIEILDQRPLSARAFDSWRMGYSTKGDGSLFDWSLRNAIPLRPVHPWNIRSFLLNQAQIAEQS
ncbi:BLUF domain-containing protein [Paracoccus yeei]